MKIIGIIGGMGPESTVEYYKGIINGYKKITGNEDFPQLYIDSINMTGVLKLVQNKQYNELIELFLNEIKKLKSIGVETVAISSNTPHIIIGDLVKKSNLPIIRIVEETCKNARENSLQKVLLTGTLFTMNSDFYKKAFNEYNIECITPNDIEKEIIQNIIFPDLENGIINEQDKIKFKEICNDIISKNNIDGLVLGCTELPLMIKENDFKIKILNTTEIHIKSIIKELV
jgi:aspartate racemase